MNIEEELKKIILDDECNVHIRDMHWIPWLIDFFKSYTRSLVLSLENPYPEDVFLPIDQETYHRIHQMLQKEFNMPIDRLAGHIGRRLWEGFRNQMLKKIEEIEEE